MQRGCRTVGLMTAAVCALGLAAGCPDGAADPSDPNASVEPNAPAGPREPHQSPQPDPPGGPGPSEPGNPGEPAPGEPWNPGEPGNPGDHGDPGDAGQPEPAPDFGGDKFKLWSAGVNLRGASIYQRIVYPDSDGPDFMGPGPLGPPYSHEDFAQLRALGCNFVNISHTGLFTQKPPYVVDEAAVANLDQLLVEVAEADMFAVISFRSGPGRGEFAMFPGQDWFPKSLVNDEIWRDGAAQDAWADMWRFTAERYKGSGVVIGYDLMVEPNPADVWFGVYGPAEFYPAQAETTYDWNIVHPRVAAAIRAVDADIPILIEAAGYASVDWLPFLKRSADERTVYVVHNYEPFSFTHQDLPAANRYPGDFDGDYDGVPDHIGAEWLAGRLQNVRDWRADGAAVAVTEYGAKRWVPNAAGYLADQTAAIEAAGAGSAIWAWTPDYDPQDSVDDFAFRHGSDAKAHEPVASEQEDVIRNYWRLNRVWPSNFR